MVFLVRLLIRLQWRIFPASSRREKAQAEQFGEWLEEIMPVPQRTEAEQAAFEAELEQRYLEDLKTPLLKREALRVTDDEKWRRGISSLRPLPVLFRVKLIETCVFTPWQTKLEQGIYDSHFVFPDYGAVSYDEIEWLELDASELTQKELEHFGKLIYSTKIARCHIMSFPMQIWRLYGYSKLPDENDIFN